MGSRRKARECALQVLYDIEFNRTAAGRNPELADKPSVDAALDLVLEDYWACVPEDGHVEDEVKVFTERLVRGVIHRLDEIDRIIQRASTNWKLERMALVDRNILRLATFELRHVAEIPPKVSLNEAIEIAKRYGSEDSSAFINGILDKISSE
jgi:N utilization substance protein B